MSAPKQITGYHFTGDTLRNGEPIPEIGAWLKHTGKIALCVSGLHASKEPFDALQYAPGSLMHKVILRGEIQTHGDPIDKYVGRERKIIASINAEPLLREFARWCALQVIHLWDAPKIVRDYLENGDKSLLDAAWDAAWDATRDATAAAGAAAWAAGWAAAADAAAAAAGAWDAAWAAAWAAAGDAAAAAALEKYKKEFNKCVKEAFK